MIDIFDRTKRGNVFEALAVMAPLVAAMAAGAVNQFADRLFLSQYSDAAIEASLPGGMLGWLFICFVMCSVAYSGTFVAQFKGAGRRRDAVRSLSQGVWLSLASAPLFLATIPIGGAFFSFFGHAPEVAAAEREYFDVMMIGAPLNVLSAVLGGYFSGMGKTRVTGAASLAGNIANIFLDWLFVFGRWGCPEGGIAGAAWASNLATFLTCAILAAMILRDKTFRTAVRSGRAAALAPDRALALRILRFGTPSGLQISLDCLTFTVFVMITGRLDAMSLAVSNVVFTINHLSFAPLSGMNQAAGVLTGNYMGAKDPASAVRAGWSSVVISWVYFALFAVFVAFCGDWLMGVFHGGEASRFDLAGYKALGKTLMWLLVAWGFFDATDIVLAGALKGAGDTKFVMAAYIIVSSFIWTPMFLAVAKFHPGIVPMWCTMPVYCILNAIVILSRWCGGRWKRLRIV